jgi:hypothetical protein
MGSLMDVLFIHDNPRKLIDEHGAEVRPHEVRHQIKDHILALIDQGAPKLTIDGGKATVHWTDRP